jgi:hypothetical protein
MATGTKKKTGAAKGSGKGPSRSTLKIASKGPTAEHRKKMRVFERQVAALAVENGLAASANDVNCRWELKLRNGKMRWVWVCD